MSRINVDFTAVADTEKSFARLASLLGLADADHARGKVEHLWVACTTRGETDLPQWLVEQHLGPRGPEALIAAELARWGGGRGDSNTRRIHIRGAEKRCLWLRHNQEQSTKGGKTRAASAQRSAGKFTSPPAGDETSLLLSPDPSSLSPDPSNQKRESVAGATSSRRAAKADPTPAEREVITRVLGKLGERNGVAYGGAAAHVKLIVGRLRDGLTEFELRAVIAYCCDEWLGDDEMRKYLRPETLFGPTTIAKYLDPARARYRDMLAKLAPQPTLSLDGGKP